MNELQFKLKHKRWQFSKTLSKKASHRRIHLRTYMLGIFHPTPHPPCSSSPLLSAPDLYEPYMSSCAFCFQNFWSQLGNPTGDGKEGRKGNQCMSSPSCLPPRWPVSLSLSLLLSPWLTLTDSLTLSLATAHLPSTFQVSTQQQNNFNEIHLISLSIPYGSDFHPFAKSFCKNCLWMNLFWVCHLSLVGSWGILYKSWK